MGTTSVAGTGGRLSLRHTRLRSAVFGLLLVAIATGAGPWAAAAGGAEPSLGRPSSEDLDGDAAILVADELPMLPPEALDPAPMLLALADDVEAMPAEASEIEALAASLGTDVDAAFRFVRDQVRVEPYAGVLRGAAGTLAARGGNAIDRAILLHDLLETMGFGVRYAFAELDAVTTASVIERAVAGADSRPTFERPPDVGPIDLRAVRDRARRDHARLVRVLGERLSGMGDAPRQAAAREQVARDASHHAWVQVERDGTWIDLDPTASSAEPGEALASAASTGVDIPPAMQQVVTLRVVAETLDAGHLVEIVALQARLDTRLASESQILLVFAPSAGGGGLFGGVEEATTYTPVLLVDGAAEVGAELPVPVTDGGGFSDLGGFDGGGGSELVALRLEVVREVPGREPMTSVRTLLDRVTPSVRASGAIDLDQLLPHVLSGTIPVALAQVHHIMVSNGGADPRAAAIDRLSAGYFAATQLADDTPPENAGASSQLWPLTALDESLPLASERAVIDSLRGEGITAFVASPRVYVVTLGPTAERPDGLSLTIDLMVDELATLAAAGTAAGEEARLRMWYGVVQAALETEFARAAAVASLDPSRRVVSASMDGGAPMSVIPPIASATADSAPQALREALDRGLTVVVAGDPVAARTWWTVSPEDGSTRAILDPALGGTSVFFGAGPDYLRIPGSTIEIQRSYMIEADRYGGVEYQLVTNVVATGSVATASMVGAYIGVVALGVALGIGLVFFILRYSP